MEDVSGQLLVESFSLGWLKFESVCIISDLIYI